MRFSIFFILSLLIACTPIQDSSLIYRHDIQQGNEIDTQMLLQLKPDMTKAQVKFILGTPLIQDSFHKNRWDYIFVLIKNGKKVERRHVILNFEKDLLKSITGEVIPSQGGNEKTQSETKVIEVDNSVNKKDDESWIDNLKFWEDDESEILEEKTIKSPEKVRQVDSEPKLESPQQPQKINAEDTRNTIPTKEKTILEERQFIEDSETKAIDKNNVMPEGIKQQQDEKNLQFNEPAKNIEQDYVNETYEINSEESINQNIQQDLLEDTGGEKEFSAEEKAGTESNPEIVNEETKSDIIETKEENSEEYFDQLLEKIGF